MPLYGSTCGGGCTDRCTSDGGLVAPAPTEAREDWRTRMGSAQRSAGGNI